MELTSSKEYKELTTEQKFKICNGCGAQSAFMDFVPDSMYGLDISEACNIHDFDYHAGITQKDKDMADMRFLTNLILLINRGNAFLKFLRRRRALKYYEAVVTFGDNAFWGGKDEESRL